MTKMIRENTDALRFVNGGSATEEGDVSFKLYDGYGGMVVVWPAGAGGGKWVDEAGNAYGYLGGDKYIDLINNIEYVRLDG
jgi:hypothetical protein